MDWLRCYPKTPPLYKSGVVYRREPPGVELWKDIPHCIADGFGDCEDLACWRAAEYRIHNVRAMPAFRKRIFPDGFSLYHIVVKLPDGKIEDPSKRLGM